jgi:hypothetical protein
MTNSTQTTLPSTFDLLPLRMTLIAAESATPARPALPSRDTNELLALQLIEKIKHPEPMTFSGLQIESPQPLHSERFVEMAESHV